MLVLLLTATTGAWAQGPWTSGDCTVTLSNGTLTVSGNGAMADYEGDQPWDNYREVITSVVVESGVTTVGGMAFYGWGHLTSVTLPEGLTSIGHRAFCFCSGLTSVTIPSTVTSIGSDAFYNCNSVTDVYLYPDPANLTWNEDGCDDFNGNVMGSTKCHVLAKHLSAYQNKFGSSVNVTFVGDLKPLTPATFSATLAEGTEDATNWSVKVGEKVAAFPVEGLEGGEKITVTYSGKKKVKSVKAVKVEATPAIDYSTAKLGDLFYSDGTFSSTLEAGKTPIGVIAYLDKEGTDDDEISEKSNGAGHGLVLCLKNAASGAAWSTDEVSKFKGQEVNDAAGLKRTTNVSGYTNTAALTVDEATAAKYPAAKAAKEYTTLTAPKSTTGWFLPSAQQWVKMQTGLGALEESSITWNSWFDNNHEGADRWEAALSKAGSGNYDSMTSDYLLYWSSSEYSDLAAVRLSVDATDLGADYGFTWNYSYKGYKENDHRVRPVLAF